MKDTTAWTLGRIADLHAECMVNKYLQPVLNSMVEALKDEPAVAAKAAWCIQCICDHWEDDEEGRTTYPLSSFFTELVQVRNGASNYASGACCKFECCVPT